MTILTRRYHFPASHRLHLSHLTEAENSRLFGKCNNPFGHGHNYILSVSVSGEVDPRTGLLVPLAALDRFVQLHVLRLFSYRNMNADIAQFSALVPTTENVAAVIAGLLRAAWDSFEGVAKIQLHAVHVGETDRNSFEIVLDRAAQDDSLLLQESVLTHA